MKYYSYLVYEEDRQLLDTVSYFTVTDNEVESIEDYIPRIGRHWFESDPSYTQLKILVFDFDTNFHAIYTVDKIPATYSISLA